MNETEFGPEYLSTYADRMASNSDELGARPFRQMSKAWNDDKKALQAGVLVVRFLLQRQLDQVRRVAA
jgi:hypothetical protein